MDDWKCYRISKRALADKSIEFIKLNENLDLAMTQLLNVNDYLPSHLTAKETYETN